MLKQWREKEKKVEKRIAKQEPNNKESKMPATFSLVRTEAAKIEWYTTSTRQAIDGFASETRLSFTSRSDYYSQILMRCFFKAFISVVRFRPLSTPIVNRCRDTNLNNFYSIPSDGHVLLDCCVLLEQWIFRAAILTVTWRIYPVFFAQSDETQLNCHENSFNSAYSHCLIRWWCIPVCKQCYDSNINRIRS